MAHLKSLFLSVQKEKSIDSDFNYWKKTLELRNKTYDIIISRPHRLIPPKPHPMAIKPPREGPPVSVDLPPPNPLLTSLSPLSAPLAPFYISAFWLPFKSINIDNNNTVFRLMVSRFDPLWGYCLEVLEFAYPTEGKVADIQDDPWHSCKTPTHSPKPSGDLPRGSPDEGHPSRDSDPSSQVLANYSLKEVQKMKVKEELTHVAFIPHQSNMVLARGLSQDIALYDTALQVEQPDGIQCFDPLIRMQGHTSGGYGMDWNPHKEAVAISAGFDGSLCLWDISTASKLDRIVNPLLQTTFLPGVGIYVDLIEQRMSSGTSEILQSTLSLACMEISSLRIPEQTLEENTGWEAKQLLQLKGNPGKKPIWT